MLYEVGAQKIRLRGPILDHERKGLRLGEEVASVTSLLGTGCPSQGGKTLARGGVCKCHLFRDQIFLEWSFHLASRRDGFLVCVCVGGEVVFGVLLWTTLRSICPRGAHGGPPLRKTAVPAGRAQAPQERSRKEGGWVCVSVLSPAV